jgi:UDP-N-acetylmuramoylalanine-D-glutamate ligase
MTPVETLRGQSVALFGLGGSGLSTARALVDGGAEVPPGTTVPPLANVAPRRDLRSSTSLRPTGAASSFSSSRPACR